MVITVTKEQAQAIKTSRDLREFYERNEEGLTEEEILDLSYDFPEEEQERVELLLQNM